VPQAVEAQVLAFAFDMIHGEHHSMNELRAGAFLRDVFAKYEILDLLLNRTQSLQPRRPCPSPPLRH